MPTVYEQVLSGFPAQIIRTIATTIDDDGDFPIPVPQCDVWDLSINPAAPQVYEFSEFEDLEGRVMYINKTEETTEKITLQLPVGYVFNDGLSNTYEFPDKPSTVHLAFGKNSVVFSILGGEGGGGGGGVETVTNSAHPSGSAIIDPVATTPTAIVLKKLTATTGITLNNFDEYVAIGTTMGRVDTVTDSSGSGEGLKDTTNSTTPDIRIKKLIAGSGITLTPAATSITIASSGGGSGPRAFTASAFDGATSTAGNPFGNAITIPLNTLQVSGDTLYYEAWGYSNSLTPGVVSLAINNINVLSFPGTSNISYWILRVRITNATYSISNNIALAATLIGSDGLQQMYTRDYAPLNPASSFTLRPYYVSGENKATTQRSATVFLMPFSYSP